MDDTLTKVTVETTVGLNNGTVYIRKTYEGNAPGRWNSEYGTESCWISNAMERAPEQWAPISVFEAYLR